MDLICPYCKEENDSSDYDYIFGGVVHGFWATCDSCKRDFDVEPVMTISFKTSEIKD